MQTCSLCGGCRPPRANFMDRRTFSHLIALCELPEKANVRSFAFNLLSKIRLVSSTFSLSRSPTWLTQFTVAIKYNGNGLRRSRFSFTYDFTDILGLHSSIKPIAKPYQVTTSSALGVRLCRQVCDVSQRTEQEYCSWTISPSCA